MTLTPPLIALLLLSLLGLGVQCLLGAVLALDPAGRRPLPAAAPLALPGLLLLAGLTLGAWQLDQLYRLCREAVDDPSLSQIALEGRAAAWVPAAVGGWIAAILALPALLGAAVGAIRAHRAEVARQAGQEPGRPDRRRAWMPAMITALAAFPGPVVLGMGLLSGQAPLPILAPPALLLPLLLLPGMIALSAPTTRPAGAAGLMLALLGTLIGARGVGMLRTLGQAPGAAASALLDAQHASAPLSLGLMGAAVAVLIGWLSTPRAHGARAPGALAALALALALALPLSIFGLRQIQVGRVAGSWPLTLTVLSAEMGVPPQQGGLPGRALVASPWLPRWLSRTPDGVSAERIEGELLDVGPALRRGDGLLLPPAMGMEDLYLALSGAEIGEIALIGCAPAPRDTLARAARDPLIAASACGSRPLLLRRALRAPPEQTLILLKNAEIDKDMEILPLAALPPLDRPTLLRAQVDATVADLYALLAKAPPDLPIYLGYGVQLDGSALPVGVEP